jgi:hypothetical protein
VKPYVSATCLICPGEESLPKEVVAHPVGNAGSNNLLLNVPQEQMAQLIGHEQDCITHSLRSNE